MYEDKLVKELIGRTNGQSVKPEELTAVFDYLKANGWKNMVRIDSNCWAHPSIEKGYPIFHWVEALIKTPYLKQGALV